jgi:hypothetical protein
VATQERFMPQMWQPRLDNGADVLAELTRRGCTLAVSKTGLLLVDPNDERVAPLKEAIRAHLPYLLVRAALVEVAQMLKPYEGQPVPQVHRRLSVQLYSVSMTTDVAFARATVVDYLTAWRELLAAREGAHE